MGLFDWKPGSSKEPEPLKPARAAAAAAVRPLNKDRVQQTLDANDFNHGTDDDDDIVALFDEHPIWFLLLGDNQEMLQIMMQHKTEFGPDKLPAVRDLLDEWNRNRLFPKAYWRESPEGGKFRVFSEVVHDYEKGATDEQLDYQLNLAISTSMQLAQYMDELLNA